MAWKSGPSSSADIYEIARYADVNANGTYVLDGLAGIDKLVVDSNLSRSDFIYTPPDVNGIARLDSVSGASHAYHYRLKNFEIIDFAGTVNDITISSAPVGNVAPTGTSKTITINEDTIKTFSTADFGFSDSNVGDTLTKVKIMILPSLGTLTLDTVAVSANQEIAVADIVAGKLKFEPVANANGNGYATIAFRVSDAELYSTSNNLFTFNVTPVNDAPVVANAIANQSIDGGSAISINLKTGGYFSDPDGGTLTYVVTQSSGAALPAWLKFDAKTGILSGTAANSNTTLSIKVTAKDASNLSVVDEFDLTVSQANLAPVAKTPTLKAIKATEGKAVNYVMPAAQFSDANGDALTYTATLANDAPLPSWLSFNALTKTLSGTPGYDQSGVISVKITASDGTASASSTLQITVANVASIKGTAAIDTINAGVGNDTITGLAGNDTISGGAGVDTIVGGAGNDTLTGGSENDIFVFDTAPNALQNVDTITDFLLGDKLQLNLSIFKGLTKKVGFTDAQFAHSTDTLTASDRIIYNSSTGELYYDADGNGATAAVQIALIGVDTHYNLAYTDFVLK
jgi:Ca2+-binding RTX toxin-like protein